METVIEELEYMLKSHQGYIEQLDKDIARERGYITNAQERIDKLIKDRHRSAKILQEAVEAVELLRRNS